jgi:hypothetical protein
MSFNIFLSRLSPYVDKTVEDHRCGFRSNRQIFLFDVAALRGARASSFMRFLDNKQRSTAVGKTLQDE